MKQVYVLIGENGPFDVAETEEEAILKKIKVCESVYGPNIDCVTIELFVKPEHIIMKRHESNALNALFSLSDIIDVTHFMAAIRARKDQ